jgi:hypothetical protein
MYNFTLFRNHITTSEPIIVKGDLIMQNKPSKTCDVRLTLKISKKGKACSRGSSTRCCNVMFRYTKPNSCCICLTECYWMRMLIRWSITSNKVECYTFSQTRYSTREMHDMGIGLWAGKLYSGRCQQTYVYLFTPLCWR